MGRKKRSPRERGGGKNGTLGEDGCRERKSGKCSVLVKSLGFGKCQCMGLSAG